MTAPATKITRALSALVAAGALWGCSSAAERSPVERRIEQTRRVIHRAVEAGVEEVEQAAPYALRARWNPPQPRAGCACPPFEVLYAGRWTRVVVRGDEATLAALAAYEGARDAAQPRPPELWFIGAPTGEMALCESTGQRHHVLQVEATGPIDDPPPSP